MRGITAPFTQSKGFVNSSGRGGGLRRRLRRRGFPTGAPPTHGVDADSGRKRFVTIPAKAFNHPGGALRYQRRDGAGAGSHAGVLAAVRVDVVACAGM